MARIGRATRTDGRGRVAVQWRNARGRLQCETSGRMTRPRPSTSSPAWKPCGAGFRSRLRVVRQQLGAAVSCSATRSRSALVVAPTSGMVLILFSVRSRPLSNHRPTCRRPLSVNCCPAGCKPSATGRLVTGSVVSRTMFRKAVPSLTAPLTHGVLEFHRDEGRGMGHKNVDVRRGIGDLFDSGQGAPEPPLAVPRSLWLSPEAQQPSEQELPMPYASRRGSTSWQQCPPGTGPRSSRHRSAIPGRPTCSRWASSTRFLKSRGPILGRGRSHCSMPSGVPNCVSTNPASAFQCVDRSCYRYTNRHLG